MIKQFEVDVVVIGSGAAGITAAIGARNRGATVALLGKDGTGKGTCTSLAGGLLGASSLERSVQDHYQDTLDAGHGINNNQLVEMVATRARESINHLRKMGVPLFDDPDGFTVDNKNNSKNIPGIPFVESLVQLVKHPDIMSIDHFHCLDLALQSDRIVGVIGIDFTGAPTFVEASSVVLATGGAAALYQRHDNPPGMLGEGYSMALKAGCRLQDMEFVQFFPLGIAEPNLPATIIYPPYPDRVRILDENGSDVLRELPECQSPYDAIIRFRDKASLLFYHKHTHGGLFLDLSRLDENDWNSQFSMRLLARKQFDFQYKKLRIAPLAHFSIGGVEVNEQSESTVAGIFAAGEVAGGFHGANRRGGNALTECVVCGSLAGSHAADFARQMGREDVNLMMIKEQFPAWAGKISQRPEPRYRHLMKSIKACAWDYFGVVRSDAGMLRGQRLISSLESELETICPVGNRDGLLHVEICSALLTLRCICEAGLLREESRGAFFREDFPERDDTHWQRNIGISLDQSEQRLVVK